MCWKLRVGGGEMVRLRWLALVLICFSGGLPGAVWAGDDLDGWRIVQVSAEDRLAVAGSPEGVLRLVRGGDRLGEHITVTGFDNERVILERPGEWGRATLYVRVVNGRQQIERRERQPLRKGETNRFQAELKLHDTR